MTHWETCSILALLVYIAFVVGRLGRDLELAREEIEEFRQYMMGERFDPPA